MQAAHPRMLILLKLTPSAALLDHIMQLFTQSLGCKTLPECGASWGSKLYHGHPYGQ